MVWCSFCLFTSHQNLIVCCSEVFHEAPSLHEPLPYKVYDFEVTNFRMSYFERRLNLHLLISDEFSALLFYFPISDDVVAGGGVGGALYQCSWKSIQF